MSISRAFTTRRVKQSLMAAAEAESVPHRSNTTKESFRSIRHKISAPVELIHTTNMLSYNAPDIYPKSASSTSSTHRSEDDLSDSALTAASSPPTSPDVESLPPPKRALSPEPNHLSCYFTPPAQALSPTKESEAEPPVIPQRAPSHTKKSYEPLVARQRSNSRMSEQSHRTVSTKTSFTFSRSSSTSTSTAATSHNSTPPPFHASKVSTASFSSPPPSATLPPTPTSQPNYSKNVHRKEVSQSQHPFGPELAQVTEIAEEYGVKERLNELDAEEKEMISKGLCKFSASDYLSEIEGLRNILITVKPAATAVWI
ncbi:hypothetical protein V8F20_006503 [Naviculisporaceae sp. PSN 640]